MMFSLALADLLVGIALIPQVIREDWIGREMEKNTNGNGTFTFPETECRFLHLYHLCILNFLQDTFWNDLAQCHHLHIHLHYDLHSKVFHDLIITWINLHRFAMHNYEDFFEDRFKSGNMFVNLSIVSCWFLGLMQAVPLLSSWNDHHVSDLKTCSLPFLR